MLSVGGMGATPPVEWSTPPAGTQSYAVVMHHIDPEGKAKWYWVLYNLPASTRSLLRNASGVGTLGNNSVNVLAIAQGSSEVSISLVVDSADTENAVKTLHELIVQ